MKGYGGDDTNHLKQTPYQDKSKLVHTNPPRQTTKDICIFNTCASLIFVF